MLSRFGVKIAHKNKALFRVNDNPLLLRKLCYNLGVASCPVPIQKQYIILHQINIPNSLKMCEQRLLKSKRVNVVQIIDQKVITLQTILKKISLAEESKRKDLFNYFLTTMKKYQKKIIDAVQKSGCSTQSKKNVLLNYLSTITWVIINRVDELQQIKLSIQTCFQLSKDKLFEDVISQIQSIVCSDQPLSFKQAISFISVASCLSKSAQNNFHAKITKYASILNFFQISKLFCNDLFLNCEISNQITTELTKNRNKATSIQQGYLKILFIKKKIGSNMVYMQQTNLVNLSRMLFQHDGFITLPRIKKMIQMYMIEAKLSFREYISRTIAIGMNTIIKNLEKGQIQGVEMTCMNLIEFYVLLCRVYPIGGAIIPSISMKLKEKSLTLSKKQQAKIKICEQFLSFLLKNIESRYSIDKNQFLNKQMNDQILFVIKSVLETVLPYRPLLIFEISNFKDLNPGLKLLQYTQQALKEVKQLSLSKKLQNTIKILDFLCLEPNFSLSVVRINQIKNDLRHIAQDFRSASGDHFKVPYLLYLIEKNKMSKSQFKKDQMGLKFYKFIYTNFIRNKIQYQLAENKILNAHTQYAFYLFFAAIELNKIIYNDNPNFFKQNQQIIESFLNKKMVPQIKSIPLSLIPTFMKMINDQVKPSVEVLQSLFSATSKLIVYSSDQDTLYINPFFSEEFYINLIKFALMNKLQMIKISEKQILRPLQTIFYVHRKKFDSDSVLEMLEILQLPKYLTPAMKNFLQKVPFSKQQLAKVDHQLVKNFEYCNLWIQSILSKKMKINLNELKHAPNIQDRIMSLSKSDQRQLFSNPQFYRILFQTHSYQPKEIEKIPEPLTYNSAYDQSSKQILAKKIYICFKMYIRIKKHFKFELEHIVKSGFKKQDILKLNFDQQIHYLKKKGLLGSRQSVNLFHVDQRVFGHQFCLELWKSYNIKKAIQVEDFLAQKQTDVSIFSCIIRALTGKIDQIKQVLGQYGSHSKITYQAMQLNYDYDTSGALIEVFENKSQTESQISAVNRQRVLIICYNQTNYKALYICAYLLHEKGYNVCLVGKDYNQSQLQQYLQRYLSKKNVSKQPIQELEQYQKQEYQQESKN